MILSLKPSIILNQETVMEGTTSKEVLEPWLKDWNFVYINSDGHSRGLITSWSQDFAETVTTNHSIILKTVLKEKIYGDSFYFYNVYGPYHNKKVF